jgi:hypothetical protein
MTIYWELCACLFSSSILLAVRTHLVICPYRTDFHLVTGVRSEMPRLRNKIDFRIHRECQGRQLLRISGRDSGGRKQAILAHVTTTFFRSLSFLSSKHFNRIRHSKLRNSPQTLSGCDPMLLDWRLDFGAYMSLQGTLRRGRFDAEARDPQP